MAFESYITYEEYVSFGGKVSEDAFLICERKAQRQLDYLTFNRIHHLTAIPDIVKEVLVDFIDKIFDYEQTTGGVSNASTYSNGIESYSFDNNAQTKFNRELSKLAARWLPEYLTARSVNFDVDKYLQSENNNP